MVVVATVWEHSQWNSSSSLISLLFFFHALFTTLQWFQKVYVYPGHKEMKKKYKNKDVIFILLLEG